MPTLSCAHVIAMDAKYLLSKRHLPPLVWLPAEEAVRVFQILTPVN
jgi:hypothetical protein